MNKKKIGIAIIILSLVIIVGSSITFIFKINDSTVDNENNDDIQESEKQILSSIIGDITKSSAFCNFNEEVGIRNACIFINEITTFNELSDEYKFITAVWSLFEDNEFKEVLSINDEIGESKYYIGEYAYNFEIAENKVEQRYKELFNEDLSDNAVDSSESMPVIYHDKQNKAYYLSYWNQPDDLYNDTKVKVIDYTKNENDVSVKVGINYLVYTDTEYLVFADYPLTAPTNKLSFEDFLNYQIDLDKDVYQIYEFKFNKTEDGYKFDNIKKIGLNN